MSVREKALAELRSKGVTAEAGQGHDYAAAQRASIVRSGCGNKVRHESKAAALSAIAVMKRTKRVRRLQWFDAYQCPHCAGWHLAKGLPR